MRVYSGGTHLRRVLLSRRDSNEAGSDHYYYALAYEQALNVCPLLDVEPRPLHHRISYAGRAGRAGKRAPSRSGSQSELRPLHLWLCQQSGRRTSCGHLAEDAPPILTATSTRTNARVGHVPDIMDRSVFLFLYRSQCQVGFGPDPSNNVTASKHIFSIYWASTPIKLLWR